MHLGGEILVSTRLEHQGALLDGSCLRLRMSALQGDSVGRNPGP